MRRSIARICAAAAVLSGGCPSRTVVRQAKTAERAGRFAEAYDLYAQAVARNPSRKDLADDLHRVSRSAATIWSQRGYAAEKASDVETAWKCYMRQLSIRPDHVSAVEAIRRLEAAHGPQLARARRDWFERGFDSLAIAEPPVAQPRFVQAQPAPGTGPSKDGTGGGAADRTMLPAAVGVTLDQDTVDRGAAVGDPLPAKPPRRKDIRTPERPPSAIGSTYLVRTVVSRNDDRYPEMAQVVDGLSVRVRDTDHDPDADLDVYLGNKRVRKARNVPVGGRIHVRGRSGTEYDIVVLKILDHQETVLFGVMIAGDPDEP